MTRSEFHLFLEVAMGICGLMAVLNLFKYRSRKNAAFFLAGAFAALGAVFFALVEEMSTVVVGLLGVLVLALLAGDFIIRSGMEHPKP